MVLEPKELKFVGGLGSKDRVGDGKELSRNYPQGERVYDSQGIGCSQTAQGGGTGSYTGLYLHDYRIRKLTPKECWRLMAFTDEDFHKAEEVNSNTQLYKQAGNSIVVKVLEAIFKQML
jgi:DNA (cytosine-5)-methyltransferase 1